MPFWLLALIYIFLLSLVLSIWAALGDSAALASLILTTTLLILLAFKSALVIELDENELRVGRAHIEIKFIGAAEPLTKLQVQKLRTRDADPAAFLGIRFWSSTGVRVKINDARDTTPYWLITSNQGDALAKALNSN